MTNFTTRLGPEWTAAIALSIQAFIFLLQAFILGWQGLILRRHAATLEEHTDIAGTQAETAKLIGQALDRQAKVLEKQTQIMDEQFRFQRRVDAKQERALVFSSVLDLAARVRMLGEVLSRYHQSNFQDEDSRRRVNGAWDRLGEAILPCRKALLTAIHLSAPEKDYFDRYAKSVDALKQNRDPRQDIESVASLEGKYQDFGEKLLSVAAVDDSKA